MRVGNANAGFIDMLDGSPVEILAAEIGVAAIDREEFRVDDPVAREARKIEQPELEVGDGLQAVERLLIRGGEALLSIRNRIRTPRRPAALSASSTRSSDSPFRPAT